MKQFLRNKKKLRIMLEGKYISEIPWKSSSRAVFVCLFCGGNGWVGVRSGLSLPEQQGL